MEDGAKADHSLIWINRPSKYTTASNYAKYEVTNKYPHLGRVERSVETVYVAAAIIVEIPAFGIANRNGTFP